MKGKAQADPIAGPELVRQLALWANYLIFLLLSIYKGAVCNYKDFEFMLKYQVPRTSASHRPRARPGGTADIVKLVDLFFLMKQGFEFLVKYYPEPDPVPVVVKGVTAAI